MNFLKKIGSILFPFKKADEVFKNVTRKKPKTVLLIIVSVVSLFSVDAKIITAINYVGTALIEAFEQANADEINQLKREDGD